MPEQQQEQPKKKPKMTRIWAIVIIVVAGGVVLYLLLFQQKESSNTNQATNTNTVTNTTSEIRYQGDGFSFIQPTGWTEGHVTGSLVSFHNSSEQHPDDSAAAKINFQSYMAVTFDSTNDMTLAEINEATINSLKAVIPSTNVVSTTDEAVNGLQSKFSTVQFIQQDVDYTVLMTINLAGSKYYLMSFNTTTEKWPEDKDDFFRIARSFKME